MILFDDKKDFQKHILIRSLIDIEYLEPYEEVAIRRKIHPFIPEDVITELKSDEKLYNLLKKAVAHYTIPIAAPLLKVTLSNTGISNLKDSEMINAQWWDVRDMALQCATIADETLTDLMDALLVSEYRARLSFLDKFNNIIFKSPDEFFSIINLNGGYDVFLNLIPNIEHIWSSILKEKIPDCVFEKLNEHAELFELMKKAVAFFSLADAIDAGGFVFTRSGIFIQWEQLPWQKAAVMSAEMLARLSKSMYSKANQMMELISKYLNNNSLEFPCMKLYKPTERKAILKKSGIYF